MPQTVLYRKWRPHRFADVVGQDPIVRTLQNAITQDKIAHAYLFAGPRGTGKTSIGRILARAINSATDETGDLADTDAGEFEASLDLVEIDAASNRGIDNIRDLRERANYAPTTAARFKVYLIDEVHQLTDAAADALLKTLEEPPPHIVFILATTDPEQLKATVLSRCQRFDFRRIGVEALTGHLRGIADAEGIEIPDEALALISREATGSARDAINLLDQVWASHGSPISLENAVEALGLSIDKRALDLARAALTKDLKDGLAVLGAVQEDAVDLHRFKRQVVEHLRHALLVQSDAADTLALSEPERQALVELVKGVEPATTVAALKALNDADVRPDPYLALPLEIALGRLAFEKELQPPPAAKPRARSQAGSRQGNGQGQRAQGDRGRQSQRRSQPPSARRGETPDQPRPERRQPASAASAPEKSPPPAPVERTPQEQVLFDIRQQLKASGEHKLVGILNGSCTIPDVKGDEIVLQFLPMYVDFHLGMVQEQAAAVTAAACAALGRTVTLRCMAAEGDADRKVSLVEEAEKLGAKRVGPGA